MASTAKQDPKLDPSTVSSAYAFMAPKWGMIETLLGGTSAMRVAGAAYLPQHPAEDSTDYDRRLHQTTLYNMTDLTLNSLCGRVFRETLKLNDDVPEALKAFCEDVDSKETDISSFSQQWFREALAKGFAHVMIDMPALSSDEKITRTKLDDRKEGRRPYWSLIKPENAIFMYWETIDGAEVLTHARILERVSVMDGFTEVWRTQIKVLMQGRFEIWKDENEGTKNKPHWIKVSDGTFDLPIIPLLTFYTNGECGVSKPPLEDLAYMNIRHWQSTSDQINVLTVARFPMLAASGANIEKGKNSMPIGPRQLLTMRDANGRFYYVEHSGKSIKAGQDDIEQLEDRMAAYGAEFLRRQVAGRTAFERAQDTNEAISPLKDMALRFEEMVGTALDLTAKWMSLPPSPKTDPNDVGDTAGGTVTINTKFTEEDENDAAFRALGEARKRGDISRKTFIAECIRRGLVDQTMNVQDEIDQIMLEFKEGPHPPTFYAGQEQIQGVLGPDGNLIPKGDSTLPAPVDSSGKSLLTKPPATKKKTKPAVK